MTELEKFVAEMPAALANRQKGADEERAAIVAWLRANSGPWSDQSYQDAADAIEAGDHEPDG